MKAKQAEPIKKEWGDFHFVEVEEQEYTGNKKSPFRRFYQVNKDNSPVLRKCLEENPTALKLLFFIFDHMDEYNAVMCSYAVFQECLGISKPTITRSIRYLKANCLIYVYKSGTSNVYVANKHLVWRSWGNNWEYSKFPANIVLTSSEQREFREGDIWNRHKEFLKYQKARILRGTFPKKMTPEETERKLKEIDAELAEEEKNDELIRSAIQERLNEQDT